MASAVPVVDSLIRDYLIFRGFNSAVKSFDGDCKSDRDHKFKIETIAQEMVALISSYDLKGLKALWDHFKEKVFVNLTEFQSEYADKLESDLYKLYLANCVHHAKTEKITQFFELLTPRFHRAEGWSDWFALPYLSNSNDAEPFRQYFNKQWQEMFLVSVHNFLAIAFYQMQTPALLACVSPISDSTTTISDGLCLKDSAVDRHSSTSDLMDDFAIIAQCQGTRSTVPHSSSTRSLRSVLRRKFASKKSSAD